MFNSHSNFYHKDLLNLPGEDYQSHKYLRADCPLDQTL
jgi:hypothetical protein